MYDCGTGTFKNNQEKYKIHSYYLLNIFIEHVTRQFAGHCTGLISLSPQASPLKEVLLSLFQLMRLSLRGDSRQIEPSSI